MSLFLVVGLALFWMGLKTLCSTVAFPSPITILVPTLVLSPFMEPERLMIPIPRFCISGSILFMTIFLWQLYHTRLYRTRLYRSRYVKSEYCTKRQIVVEMLKCQIKNWSKPMLTKDEQKSFFPSSFVEASRCKILLQWRSAKDFSHLRLLFSMSYARAFVPIWRFRVTTKENLKMYLRGLFVLIHNENVLTNKCF